MAVVLVVDDEMGIRELLSEILEDEGHTVELAANAAQAREARARITPDLVLLDIWMPDTDGVTLLKEWSTSGQLSMPVVMMSGHGTIDNAVEATKIGASAFLEKPITLQKLLKAVDGALKKPAAVELSRVSAAGVAGVLPGNVAFATAQAQAVAAVVLPDPRHTFDLDKPLRMARDDFERVYFEFHLSRENGSMTRVAEKTGLERTHLYRKLKQLGVDISRGGRRNSAEAQRAAEDTATEGDSAEPGDEAELTPQQPE
jgi:DNA-binding NtrC family response regulator